MDTITPKRCEPFLIASDIETVIGKLESLRALLYDLTEDTNLTYFSLMYHVEFIGAELRGVCDRAYSFARGEKVGAVRTCWTEPACMRSTASSM